ncbi:MAG: amidohydrolase family protein [Planctomycetota bacterium]|nr:amidohydrolase family protein [Planctomycetota bacterium]
MGLLKKRLFCTGLAATVLTATTWALPQEEKPSDDASIFVEVLHTSTGDTLKNVHVTVKDGRIDTITAGTKAGENSVTGAVLTAGMIDLSPHITYANNAVEQTNELESRLSVAGALDLFSPTWKRLARTGVTTVLVTPPDRNVVGGMCAIMKTQGSTDLAKRQLNGQSFLRGAMGDAPSSGNRPAWGSPDSIYNRRPTTRMGVEWEWRKAFYDAAAAGEFPELEFPGADVFRAVLAGNVNLYVQAFAMLDIRTAVFLKEEMRDQGFGEMNLWIDGGSESWKDAQLLKRSGSGVVLAPFPASGRSNERSFMAWRVAKDLAEAGIPFTLSAHGGTRPGTTIGDQAGRAMHGGLDFQRALNAVTIEPARALGMEDRIGTSAVGKAADLVMWSGPPFELTSRILAVWVDGVLITPSTPQKN